MSSTCFNPSDFMIPAFDADAKTVSITISIHPAQTRLLDYFTSSQHLGFRNSDDVARWALSWGIHTLLGPVPSGFALLEAKMNIMHDERFQRQKDCLAESTQKYLIRGQKENARRIVELAYEEYSLIPIAYWRALWLSSLRPAIEMLEEHGIRFSWADSLQEAL